MSGQALAGLMAIGTGAAIVAAHLVDRFVMNRKDKQ